MEFAYNTLFKFFDIKILHYIRTWALLPRYIYHTSKNYQLYAV